MERAHEIECLHEVIGDSGEIEEIIIDEIEFPSLEELENVEYDRRFVKKLSKDVKIMTELYTNGTEFYYDYPRRTRFEIEGGYKSARKKGALLNEVTVFNARFRFRNERMDHSQALAFTYYSQKFQQEIIVLLPDDTEETFNKEVSIYLRYVNEIEKSGKINIEQIKSIKSNLDLLNIPERCAQTLMHEYGHILHMRIFKRKGIETNFDVYNWFLNHGYTKIIEKRVPNYIGLSPAKKLWLLKECFVEDYRISLNLGSSNGMFILPGKYTFAADLRNPDIMNEGVNMMREMLKTDYNKAINYKVSSGEQEITDFDMMNDILNASLSDDWEPGQVRMTEEDHISLAEEFLKLEPMNKEKHRLINVLSKEEYEQMSGTIKALRHHFDHIEDNDYKYVMVQQSNKETPSYCRMAEQMNSILGDPVKPLKVMPFIPGRSSSQVDKHNNNETRYLLPIEVYSQLNPRSLLRATELNVGLTKDKVCNSPKLCNQSYIGEVAAAEFVLKKDESQNQHNNSRNIIFQNK